MMDNQFELSIGDYVFYLCGKNQEYPGKIVEKISNDEYGLEICVNRKKSEGNEIEIVHAKRNKLRPMLIK
ncbi:hypothetical protein NDS46_31360 (plasmid) [Paenibacillus thiaminolyticus]|uniref:hypothetical protein n=1 Tax=Paenibacillus thiaminolyticus TaxID=49283 RepID=UPI00232CC379|nr:hypothetical protein [Paenibacillus thiaminolyticus]WCF11457.1 hypothetical protein NDS46_31360 [Paenibacillus thiaminolyticus]